MCPPDAALSNPGHQQWQCPSCVPVDAELAVAVPMRCHCHRWHRMGDTRVRQPGVHTTGSTGWEGRAAAGGLHSNGGQLGGFSLLVSPLPAACIGSDVTELGHALGLSPFSERLSRPLTLRALQSKAAQPHPDPSTLPQPAGTSPQPCSHTWAPFPLPSRGLGSTSPAATPK